MKCCSIFMNALWLFFALTIGCGGSDFSDSDASQSNPKGGDGGDPACVNLCSEGAKQCTKAGWQACVKQSNGCTDWGKETKCPLGEICSGGVCRKNCINQCSEGAKQCSGSGVVVCKKMDTGCLDWGANQPCSGGTVCSGGKCVKNCVDQCTEGAEQCSGSGGIITCEKKASGCTDWGNPVPCSNGLVCSGGKCLKNCVNQCTEGAKQCSGTGVQTCEKMPSGCTDWGNAMPCKAGQICSGGKCVGNCTNQCSDGATRCNGTNIQTCKLMPSGCTDWDTPQACSSGTCVNGKCDSASCLKGDRRCKGTTVETCDVTGVWITTQVCPQACEKGSCTLQVTCSAVSRRCNGTVVEECNPTGTAWLYVRSCPLGCQNGLCLGGCDAGELRCNGKNVEKCKSDGSGWQNESTCSQTYCTDGKCAELELKLDNMSQSLEGDHVYAGDVVLKNNSKITVGSSGWLRIRAKNILIDGTSSISAPAAGDSAGGEGGRGTSLSCKLGYCSSSVSGNTTGGGGGYGTGGSGKSTSIYNCYYSGNRYCTINSHGGYAHGAFLSDISMGSSGGSCSKPNGGGMIDLFASQTLTVEGTLKADGGSGSDGGGSYCGGGSGGGIRLIGEELVVKGILSVEGGSPGGGHGRIKLLYGSKNTIQATTKGTVEESRIPPLDLRSSTHPDPDRYYNNEFEIFNLSWSRPFSNLASYYYLLNTSLPSGQNQVPNSQSTYHVSESVSFPSTDLKTGNNYFHVVSVGPLASFGTMETAFKVQINSKPPTISSSSHPSSSQWYNQPTAVFSWKDPLASENFNAYYYVFDRYADTIPTKSDSSLPVTDKQLSMPSLPPGTIWFLHVIAEDTMGYLTKEAAHFKIQVGPEPAKGGISGDIWEAGSSPPLLLDGVKISLNRGVQSTTSSGGGKYFFSTNTVYEGSYELRATKDGYETYVAQVKVSGGQNTSHNIQLKKLP